MQTIETSIDDRTAVVEKTGETAFNGMVNVDIFYIHYRGFTIKPKLDMGSSPWLSHANSFRTGWVVVKDGCNALPGATWCHSPFDAKATIDLWIEAEFDAQQFWKLMEPYRY